MLRAEYCYAKDFQLEDLKHTALNFDLYTHFTSPIRRYPDMLVHRLIKSCLQNKKDERCLDVFIILTISSIQDK